MFVVDASIPQKFYHKEPLKKSSSVLQVLRGDVQAPVVGLRASSLCIEREKGTEVPRGKTPLKKNMTFSMEPGLFNPIVLCLICR